MQFGNLFGVVPSEEGDRNHALVGDVGHAGERAERAAAERGVQAHAVGEALGAGIDELALAVEAAVLGVEELEDGGESLGVAQAQAPLGGVRLLERHTQGILAGGEAAFGVERVFHLQIGVEHGAHVRLELGGELVALGVDLRAKLPAPEDGCGELGRDVVGDGGQIEDVAEIAEDVRRRRRARDGIAPVGDGLVGGPARQRERGVERLAGDIDVEPGLRDAELLGDDVGAVAEHECGAARAREWGELRQVVGQVEARVRIVAQEDLEAAHDGVAVLEAGLGERLGGGERGAGEPHVGRARQPALEPGLGEA